MALNPADIAVLSQLLDQALELPASQHEAWLAALPAEHQAHVETLRDMLDQVGGLDTDARLAAPPKVALDESVAHQGDLVGPYRLIRELGRGGMGSVWMAERADGAYKRQVALKLPRLAWGAGLAERMAREREIGMLLEHPNIARLYDAGVDERGRPYLALELIDGQPIDAWCEAHALGVQDRLKLFVQVIRAAAYAHGRLVVHRDLKPSNVLVTPDGQAHLLDFGIAKLLHEAGAGEPGLTQQQGRVLTPHYASPEQVAGDAITVQSDVYSLGVLLYELLTGTLPIAPKRGSLGAVEEAILEGDAPPASSRVADKAVARALRGEVDAILAMAMQREPARRYATADALALDITRHLDGETVAARPDSIGYRLRKSLRRHWMGMSAMAAVLLAIIAGSGVAVLQAQRAAQQALRARLVTDFVSEVFRVNTRQSGVGGTEAPLSPEQYLDQGARLIQARFANEPDTQAELFDVVGRIYADIGANKLAIDYATRQADVLTRLPGERVRQARAALLLADVFSREERATDAEQQARHAMELAGGDGTLWLEAVATLANAQLENGKVKEANQSAGLAEAVSARTHAPSVGLAQLNGLQAKLAERENRFDDAKTLFDRAIENALQAEGPQSRVAIDLRMRAAYVFVDSWRSDLGMPYMHAALQALRARGGADAVRAAVDEVTIVVRKTMFGQGSMVEAQDALDRGRAALAQQKLHASPVALARLDFNEGYLYYGWEDFERAARLLANSAPALLAASDSLEARQRILRAQALVAGVADDQLRAVRLWLEIIELEQRTGKGTHVKTLASYMSVVNTLIDMGAFDRAEVLWNEARRLAKDSAVRHWQEKAEALGAYIKLRRGDVAGAVAAVTPWDRIPDARRSDGNGYYVMFYAELWCNTGHAARGLPLRMLRVESLLGEGLNPHAMGVAVARAEAGLCALAAGNRPLAEEMARLARSALATHPRLSRNYREASRRLDAALGIHAPSTS